MRKTGLIRLVVLLIMLIIIILVIWGTTVEAKEADGDIRCSHEYEQIESKPASCNANGYRIYRCNNCQDEKTEIVHTLNRHRAKTQIVKVPTFTKKGISVTFCDDCNMILSMNSVRKYFDLFKLICCISLILGCILEVIWIYIIVKRLKARERIL